jgi:hypothetical protein
MSLHDELSFNLQLPLNAAKSLPLMARTRSAQLQTFFAARCFDVGGSKLMRIWSDWNSKPQMLLFDNTATAEWLQRTDPANFGVGS